MHVDQFTHLVQPSSSSWVAASQIITYALRKSKYLCLTRSTLYSINTQANFICFIRSLLIPATNASHHWLHTIDDVYLWKRKKHSLKRLNLFFSTDLCSFTSLATLFRFLGHSATAALLALLFLKGVSNVNSHSTSHPHPVDLCKWSS